MAARIRHPGALGASWRHLSLAGCRGGGIPSKVGSGAPWWSSVADEGAGLNQRRDFCCFLRPRLCVSVSVCLFLFFCLCVSVSPSVSVPFSVSLSGPYFPLSPSPSPPGVSPSLSLSLFLFSLGLCLSFLGSLSLTPPFPPLLPWCLSVCLSHTHAHTCPPLFLLLHLHDHNVTLSVVWAPNKHGRGIFRAPRVGSEALEGHILQKGRVLGPPL